MALDAYEATGQLKRVSQRTDWISNTVVLEREPTPTKPGITQISLNPSQTLDKAILCPKYLHKLHGMQYMSVKDIQEAFQNIPLSLRSSLMTTTFRPWGRHRWTRPPFGIIWGYYPLHPKNGSAEFIWYWPPSHQCCDEILIPGCVVNNTEARIDHERNLINVLKEFVQCHVKLHVNKMKLLVRKAIFMSHVTNTDGFQPNPVTVKAIIAMPTPTDKEAVSRFIGAINYLAKFCPQLSSVTQPLYNLTNPMI